MSTYLVGWVIGQFEFIEQMSECGANVRIYTPIGRIQEAKLPLKIAVQSLDYYSKLFHLPYCLPKLDIISLHGK